MWRDGPPLVASWSVLSDYDFHPDEATVRIFRTPTSGVLRFDDAVAVTVAIHDGVVLRHYSFADHWFKINVTTDLAGNLVETGDASLPFAFNCDIATPMEREGDSTFGVDLFVDVLVRADAATYTVGDQEELAVMLDRGLVSESEGRGAMRGLGELIDIVGRGHLLAWLDERAPGRSNLRRRHHWSGVPSPSASSPGSVVRGEHVRCRSCVSMSTSRSSSLITLFPSFDGWSGS